MNNHLPECYQSEGKWGGGCICIRLRACEERVEESMDRAWEKFSRDQFDAGYAAALDAAREAVAALKIGVLTTGTLLLKREDALVAIDALREKP